MFVLEICDRLKLICITLGFLTLHSIDVAKGHLVSLSVVPVSSWKVATATLVYELKILSKSEAKVVFHVIVDSLRLLGVFRLQFLQV